MCIRNGNVLSGFACHELDLTTRSIHSVQGNAHLHTVSLLPHLLFHVLVRTTYMSTVGLSLINGARFDSQSMRGKHSGLNNYENVA